MFARAFAAESMHTFCRRLVDNVIRLMTETSADQVVVPTAVFLVLDQAHGGDATAEEIQRRFRFLDVESRDVIDFHLLGWQSQADGTLAFDLASFQSCRDDLLRAGVRKFGGYADILIFDVCYRDGRI
jgi:hypothetical protein